jgi:carboxyl-terminal processing protease
VANRIRTIAVALLVACLLGPSQLATTARAATTGCVTQPDPSPVPDAPFAMPEVYRIALFDSVWQAVNEGYVDPEFNGADWAAIQEQYAPWFLALDNAWEVYSLLDEMVGLLNDPVTQFVSGPELEGASQDPSYAGIGTLVDQDGAGVEGEGVRVLYVFPGSAAEDVGIRERDLILSVDGNPCPSVATIRGPEGTSITLSVQSPAEDPRDIVVERRRIDPTIRPISARIGASGAIGYLRLMSLAGEDTIAAVNEALGSLLEDDPISGLVLDLRHTTIGAPGVVVSLLGQFLEGDLATLVGHSGETPLSVEAGDLKSRLDDVRVVVLLDDHTVGEAERLAAILQAHDRARVIGQQTPGDTHIVQSVDLVDGSVLQLAVAGLELPDGSRLEGSGVTPDQLIDGEWLDLPAASDPYLQAAVDSFRTFPPPRSRAQ